MDISSLARVCNSKKKSVCAGNVKAVSIFSDWNNKKNIVSIISVCMNMPGFWMTSRSFWVLAAGTAGSEPGCGYQGEAGGQNAGKLHHQQWQNAERTQSTAQLSETADEAPSEARVNTQAVLFFSRAAAIWSRQRGWEATRSRWTGRTLVKQRRVGCRTVPLQGRGSPGHLSRVDGLVTQGQSLNSQQLHFVTFIYLFMHAIGHKMTTAWAFGFICTWLPPL